MQKEAFISKFTHAGKPYTYFDINRLEQKGWGAVRRLPYSIRVLVENLLRHWDEEIITAEDLKRIGNWQPTYSQPVEIPYHPARVLMQDFTGVPAIVDLAAMRDAVVQLGGDAGKVNPLVPVDLIVDHSIQIDAFGSNRSMNTNVSKEYERNGERYALLKWAQKNFENVHVVPPNSGICHQVNLEYLGRVVFTEVNGEVAVVYPDTLVGTDSHTTMINGIGVLGWGVGGIEAEAVMLGQPYYMAIPEVVGVKLTGTLSKGCTATDLVLTITEILRREKVVEKFVEFFGPGMQALSVPNRATIANMAPEYGATVGFFPVDRQTLDYFEKTGRGEQAALIGQYTQAAGLFYTGDESPEYTKTIELDLSTVIPSVAGPARPQDRIPLKDLKQKIHPVLAGSAKGAGQSSEGGAPQTISLDLNGRTATFGNGSVAIAAITSCTNTSNPNVMLGAGLIARQAVERGLHVPPHVKTSMAPGSKVVTGYLNSAGLMPYLEALGFHVVGYGCTTCIGNSGPLHPVIEDAIEKYDFNVAAVLSGNRNFEARIHQRVKGNFLMSPMLVVAFALAGRIDIDLTKDPLGLDPNGNPVYLNDLWPTWDEILQLTSDHVTSDLFTSEYDRIFDGDSYWNALPADEQTTFPWEDSSTYIRLPTFLEGMTLSPQAIKDVHNARVLLTLGDSVTTDHISPAGAIPKAYPAGQYLLSHQVDPADFNSYGARRGNHEVMMRGTFGNIRIKNRMVPGKEGSYTRKLPEDQEMYVFDAAMAYEGEAVPLIVLAGKEYGTGSSRDWAAKGTRLLGVRAVLAESYERIHRSNLVGMGVLPLVFNDGDTWEKLGLDGSEAFTIKGLAGIEPRQQLEVTAEKSNGDPVAFTVTARLDTPVEVAYFKHGGILPFVLRKIMADGN